MKMPRQQIVIRVADRHPAFQNIDPSTAFLYAPHTVTTLLVGLALLAYFGDVAGLKGTAAATASQSQHNAAAGVWAAILVFIGYSVVQGPRTSMIRPHPAVWRLVHGAAVVYVLMLVWMLLQTVDDARQFLKHLDPSLGVEVTYRDYGTGCSLLDPTTGRIAWSNIKSTLFDEFVIAHSLGWWAKALLIRNTALLWIYSVGFELMELTFAHMLPNFNECWWDSWILDVAICNSLGIYAGMATVRWLECKYTNYNWQGISELSGFVQRASRGLAQLLPYSWSKLDWMVFSSPKRCLQSLLVVAAFLTVEVNVFFLKYALWVPPSNPLNVARLVLWLLIGAPAVREYYEFIQGEAGSQPVALAGGVVLHKLGAFAWIAMAVRCLVGLKGFLPVTSVVWAQSNFEMRTQMMALESMISIKFGRGLYPNRWPRLVLVVWIALAVVFSCLLLQWQSQLRRLHRSSDGQQKHQRGVHGSADRKAQ